MKNSTGFNLRPGSVCAIVLTTACIAHADLRVDVAGGTQTSPVAPKSWVGSDISTQGDAHGLSEGLFAEGFSDAAPASKDVATSPVVRELPAAPGSASLFLSAVLSVGAWHLVRSARQYTYNFPVWYHSGGPQQIGVAVRFVPDEHLPVMFAPIAIAVAAAPVSRFRTQLRPSRVTRMALATAVPRGPPPRVLKPCL